MSFLAAIRKLWHSVAPRTHSDVEEEFRSTLEAYKEDLVRQGLSAEEAWCKARIDLGRPAAQNETYRKAIGLRLFDELGGDIRYGLRGLRRNPGFAAVAVLSLALGIGATTAMFSLIYAVLLHPFPYAGADRMMNLFGLQEGADTSFTWMTLSKEELDELGRAAPVESSQRMPGLSLVCPRFLGAISSHPMQRTAATRLLFSTTASGSGTSAAILTSWGERWKWTTPPTPSLA
jgi:hypothetical protein